MLLIVCNVSSINKENFDWQIDSWHFDEIIIGDFKECKQQLQHKSNKFEYVK